MDEADYRRGLDRAYSALARKERTAAEMVELLTTAGLEPAVVEAVLAELTETGAVDDAEFARRYAADKRSLSSWGNDRIREALLDRGISRELIEEALAEEEESSEIERAVALIEERRYDLTLERDRARALGMLARRGYESEVAYDAIRRAQAGRWPGR